MGTRAPGGRSGVGGLPVQRRCAGEEPPYMLPGQGAHHPQGRRGTLSPTALRVRRFFLRRGLRVLLDPHQPAPDLEDPLPRAASPGSTDTAQPPLKPSLAPPPDFRHMKSTILQGAECSVGPWAHQGPRGRAGGMHRAWRSVHGDVGTPAPVPWIRRRCCEMCFSKQGGCTGLPEGPCDLSGSLKSFHKEMFIEIILWT